MGGEDGISRHWFYILLALSDRDLHGSGIVREVLELTDQGLRLWPATLYGALEELVGEGLIRELTAEEHPDGVSARRRYYRITAQGRRVLADEGERLARLAGVVRSRVAGDAETAS